MARPKGSTNKSFSVSETMTQENAAPVVTFNEAEVAAAKAEAAEYAKQRAEEKALAAASAPSDKPVTRRTREPLGTRRLKLDAPQRSGYIRRWVNDKDARVQDALRGGYNFVEDAAIHSHLQGSNRVARTVGARKDGSPMMAFLMEIQEEWYREDQQEKENDRRNHEVGIFSPSDQVGKDGQYRPTSLNSSLKHD
jgi:hypothetical protein